MEQKGKTNKHTEVLDYLKTHKKGISSIEAFKKFGATRLSAIIFNLRKRGYSIISSDETTTDRYGHRCTYTRYKLYEEIKEA